MAPGPAIPCAASFDVVSFSAALKKPDRLVGVRVVGRLVLKITPLKQFRTPNLRGKHEFRSALELPMQLSIHDGRMKS